MLIREAILSVIIATVGWCLSSPSALAAYFTPMTRYTESDWNNLVNNGGFDEEFNVSSYIGDGGGAFYELELKDIVPPDTVKDSQGQNYFWENQQQVDFELSLKDGLLTYKVGTETLVSEAVIDEIDINGMMLMANSTENSDVTLANLKLDGSSRSMEDLFSHNSNTDFIKVTGMNEDFTFTGTQIFSWNGDAPVNYELGYDIKVGNFKTVASNNLSANQQQEIPEPTTISFFSLLAIAAAIKTRKN